MTRQDGRLPEQIRDVKITRHFTDNAAGSVLIQMGKTKVLCTASTQQTVPEFLEGTGRGWVTAEYSMLPSSTPQRKIRERVGKVDGRNLEIQRIVGRSLRAVVDLRKLGERTIWLDCDVLDADGGTRTASITGAFIAMVDAVESLKRSGVEFTSYPVKDIVAAVSVGIVSGKPLLDLSYEEDSKAEVDLNVAMTASGRIIEIQGTAEGAPFSVETLNELVDLARKGVDKLVSIQKSSLTDVLRL